MPGATATVSAMPNYDPVGVREIAQRLGVARGTVAVWHHRGLMPKPRGEVSGSPAWHWPEIEKWARKTGRLPEEESEGEESSG